MSAILQRGETRKNTRKAAFVAEFVDYAEADRLLIQDEYDRFVNALHNRMAHRRVTLCDAGNGDDILALLEQFKPHSRERVEAHAREVGQDEWGESVA